MTSTSTSRFISFAFFFNYICMLLAGSGWYFRANVDWFWWTAFVCFTIFYLNVYILKRYIQNENQWCFAVAINWAAISCISFYMLLNDSSIWMKSVGLILFMVGLFCCLNRICMLIERTEWYQNIKRGREALLSQEETGAEPDPKDFELP